ncbi:MAG: NAD-dependent epimerase/dehydratase family protein [Flavobacteriaceae bacterium]|nr:NAD-dependent epimerase/dehydratase family protein [Flavobacteriaceae bacterium]
MKKTALILGATGLTGSLLLEKLIEDTRYEKIIVISRSKIDNLPSKVVQHIGDLLDLSQFSAFFKADELFCCIGTTKNKTTDPAIYKKIDAGIPEAAAKLCKQHNIPTFIVISALGAAKNSRIFYNRIKGEMETAVLAQQIEHTYILRPSLIVGHRKETRIGETIWKNILLFCQALLQGRLKKYRMIYADTIAKAMIVLANSTAQNTPIIASNTIKILAKK